MKNRSRQDIPERDCRTCGEVFKPTRKWQNFCNPTHRQEYWTNVYKLSKTVVEQYVRADTVNVRTKLSEKRAGVDRVSKRPE